jgi:molecular chaperone GrpE
MFIPEENNNSTEDAGFEEPTEATPMDIHSQPEEEQREKNELRDLLQRARADFVNYKRRIEEDRIERQNRANSLLLLKLLPVLDDLERALQNIPEGQSDQPWIDGVDLIRRKLENLLDSEGISRIEVEEQIFDPSEHEALLYQESDIYSSNQIISVVLAGYKLHGRVLRPAQVIVGKNRQAEHDLKDITEREE